MQRRALSTILLGTSATAALGMTGSAAQTATTAQASTAPCYAITPAEVAAGVTPANLAYQQGDVRRYGADPSGATDSTYGDTERVECGGRRPYRGRATI